MRTILLSVIYDFYVRDGGLRSNAVEYIFSNANEKKEGVCEKNNIIDIYIELFCAEERGLVEVFFHTFNTGLKGMPFEQCDDLLKGLLFAQHVVATALWKYHLNVGDDLEDFARDFDRLDVCEERKRLYQKYQ